VPPTPAGRRHTTTTAAVTGLSSVIGVLATVAAVLGLLPGGGAARTVTSIRGEPVQLHGHGLYRYDTVFIAEGSKGTDLVTVLLGVPLLVLALAAYRRGSRRGGLLLAGALSYFLYVYASRALFNAYNPMFLGYIAVFSASVYALLLVVTAVDRAGLGERLTQGPPRRGLAWFLAACGAVTAAVWLLPLVAALAAGRPPELLDTYTTTVTDVLDLGLIVPTLFVAAGLVRRRAPLGHVLAAALIVLLVLIAATIIAGTVLQLRAGVAFSAGQIVGPIAGFLLLGAIGVVLLLRLLHSVPAAGAPTTDTA
jgi:hypothetical protein